MNIRDFHEEIARLAYELFELNGCRHGDDLVHWLEAERIVAGRQPAPAEGKPKRRQSAMRSPAKKTAGKKGTTKKAGGAKGTGTKTARNSRTGKTTKG
jgi:hypothetical protein